MNTTNNFAIFIPARYDSSRFPGKPLHKILDKPMIQWVYENMQAATEHVYVVTDHNGIDECIQSINGRVIRVDEYCVSGTERLVKAWNKLGKDFDFIVNVQGDEPLLTQDSINSLIDFHSQNANTFDVTTLGRKRVEAEELLNPNIVKLVKSSNGNGLYFSRAPIPWNGKEVKPCEWFQHIGVYCFSKKFLEIFFELKPTDLEERENLEQLRWLESGYSIGVLESNINLIGVDTPEDIEKIEVYLQKDSGHGR